MQSNSVIQPKGLYTNPNPFSVSPEGALLKADNVVIDEDGTIRSRRGQEVITPNAEVHTSTGYRPVKCWWYENRVWVHFQRPTADSDGMTNRIMFWDFSAQWIRGLQSATTFCVDSTGKIKVHQAEANRRQLITTASGIYRGVAGTPSQDTVISAGVPRGIDLRFTALTAVGAYDPMPATSVAGYRAVWRVIDANQIVSIGAPSGKCTVKNTTNGQRTPTIRIGIPTGSGTKTMVQVYRTQFFSVGVDGTYPDPGDEMYLVAELTPTSTDITNNYIAYSDIVTDGLLGQPLYTNQNQDGDVQARSVPPCAKDVAYFNDTAFYANTISKQRLIVSILAVDSSGIGTYSGVTVGDVIQVGDLSMIAVDGGTTGLPVAAENLGGPDYWKFAIDRTTGAGSEIVRVQRTTESFCYKYNLWSNVASGRYYAYNITGANDIVGKILFEERAINGSVKCYFNCNRLDSPPQFIPTPVTNTLAAGLARGLSLGVTQVNNLGAGTGFDISFNAAHTYLVGDQVFFSWFGVTTAGSNSKVPPNAYTITSIPANAAGDFRIRINVTVGSIATDTWGGAPPYVGYCHLIVSTIASSNDARTNRVMYSALQEPEGVPLLNSFEIGRNDAECIRLQPLGQSLFVFKEDGLFRITGQAGGWQVDEFDASVRLLASESIATVNGCIYCLTDQGVVRINESGCNVISREIENDLYSAIAANTSITRKEAFGIGYDDDRKYILWMPTSSSDTRPTQAFVYNMFTKSWTKRTDQANCGLVGRRNDVLTDLQKLYTVKDKESWLTQERKTNSIKDYADESKTLTSTYSGASSGSIRFSVADTTFIVAGTLFVANADDSKRGICTDTSGAGTVAAIECLATDATNGIAASDPANWGTITSIIAYLPIAHSVTFNHFAGEHINTLKSFSEVYFTFDQPYFTKASLSYQTDLLPTVQSATLWAYGYTYWNTSFPWPMRVYTGQLLGRTIRALLPTASAKCSQLIVNIAHNRPWENLSIRGITLRSNETTSTNVQRSNA